MFQPQSDDPAKKVTTKQIRKPEEGGEVALKEFHKKSLIDELLGLGHARITPEIAQLVGDAVENQIKKRSVQQVGSEMISDLVAQELEKLGLIGGGARARGESVKRQTMSLPRASARATLSPEVLEIMVPKPSALPSTRIRAAKSIDREGVRFSVEGVQYGEAHLCARDGDGVLVEDMAGMLRRVSHAVAEVDDRYGCGDDVRATELAFYNLMASTKFLPDPAVLKNAGFKDGFLATSVVVPVEDTTESIFGAMKQAAIIHKMGGECGFSFSQVRPKLDRVKATAGVSSGPIAFIRLFHEARQVLHREASEEITDRCLLNIDHPDILEFIELSASYDRAPYFRRSVGITDSFIQAVKDDVEIPLINPRSGEGIVAVRARKIFKRLVTQIQKHGEPQPIFLDHIQRTNHLPSQPHLECTNAQGDQPLSPFEVCQQGVLNLALFVREERIDWDGLRIAIHQAVHFLDNVIDLNHNPLLEMDEAANKNRKISLGVMGWANLLTSLELGYASDEALNMAEKLMAFIQDEAERASITLGALRGPFPNYPISLFQQGQLKRRHLTTTGLVMTGIHAVLAGCREGIEPFASESCDSDAHLGMQAVFQKYTENGVYKEIILPDQVSEEEVARILLSAHQLGLKGVHYCPSKHGERTDEPSAYATLGALASLKKRPAVISGLTKRVQSSCGRVYLTLNEGDDRLVEILLRPEKPGGCMPAQLEALARLVTLCLRAGLSPMDIAHELLGVPCHLHSGVGGGTDEPLSHAEAIGRQLFQYAMIQGLKPQPQPQQATIKQEPAVLVAIPDQSEMEQEEDNPLPEMILEQPSLREEVPLGRSYFGPVDVIDEAWDKSSCLYCGRGLIVEENHIYCPQCQPLLTH